MDKKVVLGGVLGALVIFIINFGMLLLLNQILADLAISTTNLVVGLIIFLLAPVGGGFLAGLIGTPNPLRAGLIAGSIASMMILVAFLSIFGFSFQILVSSLVVVFVWVILSRVSAGFARRH